MNPGVGATAGVAAVEPDARSLERRMQEVAAAVEHELEAHLAPSPDIPPRLLAAMRYAVLGGGKRFRPFLVHAAGELAGAEPAACRRVGAAIELVHCYSLVHDDLPAMDDAELRRGKPACHKVHGEAVAILAGDALVARAFEILADTGWPAAPAVRARLVAGLARASGVAGMCGGQMLDLESGDSLLREAELVRLQSLKTGAIIRFALEAGCLLGVMGPGGLAAMAAMAAYADALGLAFQVKDDLLDLQGSPDETGKSPGRDQALGRTTFVSLLGAAGAQARLRSLRQSAVIALADLPGATGLLIQLFDYVISRRT
jgi:farnesyl diphosphate synthase